jgi:putative acetyltransferase
LTGIKPVPQMLRCKGARGATGGQHETTRRERHDRRRRDIVEIRISSPLSAEAQALLEASQAALESVYVSAEIFSASAEDLAAPNAQFLVAWMAGRPVGCVALVDKLRYGELKRLFVAASVRGTGLGRRLVEEAEALARDIGLRVLRLETGPELVPAVKIYRTLGYRERAPFGDYADLPCSLFMEKRLG